jgi:hypothetical protein
MIAGALEQLDAGAYFQVVDEPAHGRLADLQHGGGSGDGATQHNKTEGFKLARI